MEQDSTHTELLRYAYGEMDAQEALGFIEALANDVALAEGFANLENALRALPPIQFAPKQRTINNILRHSQQSALEASY